MSGFADHFSGAAADYAAFRPRYPDALFAWLAGIAPRRAPAVAWDCGTGSGQAAAALASHVATVVASDPSVAQLTHAERHERVRYIAMTAERCALTDRSIGLVTVAQALHWFDQRAFFHEVSRVLVPAGVLAIWSYGLAAIDPAIDDVLRQFYEERVGPWWPPERALIESGYATVTLPFAELEAPRFEMRARWTLAQLAGYVGTWSAVSRCRAGTGQDPMPELLERLRAVWGSDGHVRDVRWPLALRVGVK